VSKLGRRTTVYKMPSRIFNSLELSAWETHASKPITLHPLKLEEAMSALLKMKPEPKKPKTAKKSVQKNGQMSRHEVAPFIPPEVYSDTIYLYINLLPATLPISVITR